MISTSDGIIFGNTVFTNGITIKERIEGYITLTFDKPIFIKNILVCLSLVHYSGITPLGGTGSVLIDDEPNEKMWTGVEKKIIHSEEFEVNFNHYVTEGRITETCPGTFRYAFSIHTNENFHITSLMSNGVGICYELHPTVVLFKGRKIHGKPTTVPLLYNNIELPQSLLENCYTKKEYNKYVLDILCDTGCGYQGDELTGKFSITNRGKQSIEKIALHFATIVMNISNKTLSREINSSTSVYNIPIGTSTFTYKINIPMTTPPDVTDSPLRIHNAIVLEFNSGKVLKKIKRAVLPIVVYARTPNSRNVDEYIKSIKIDTLNPCSFDEIPYGLPPKYECLCPKGIETIYTMDNQVININHIKRDSTFLDYQTSCLPPDMSVGWSKNKLVFINHSFNTVSWNDPRPKNERLPQHVINECNGLLTIAIEETRGIPLRSIFCVKDLTKKNYIEGTVEVPLDSAQNNVVITVKYNKKYIGYIDIDFNLLPMDRGISSWFFLKEPEGSELGFSGMVKMQLVYSSQTISSLKTLEYPAYISTLHFPYYYVTPTLKKLNDSRNKILQTNSQQPFLTYGGNEAFINIPHYSNIYHTIPSFFPLPIPLLRSNAGYIASTNIIDVEIAKKRRPSASVSVAVSNNISRTASPGLNKNSSYSSQQPKVISSTSIPPTTKENQPTVSIIHERPSSPTPKIPTLSQNKEKNLISRKRRLSLGNFLSKKSHNSYGTLED
ncbi:hypothetical protein ENUP19_0057G0097 [Entamoeba nuttalli]|uniref:Arrestin (Or s-antigen), n-terminal domain containing protein n=2 Tax=Entamoeba nuttalli TaxID=412467 RepID=K2HVL6_ENTNP|nr:hypothetical protein ENU1_095270 [Entamoeba nuttalli P19]EKE40300.1 hypothetical protein ENU1_095270 [Entamoeba nuttalli P19]|eukprot:XP_008857364.1 hypothetical protein ENU1_095270 [Entamoeba nuttalli P19]